MDRVKEAIKTSDFKKVNKQTCMVLVTWLGGSVKSSENKSVFETYILQHKSQVTDAVIADALKTTNSRLNSAIAQQSRNVAPRTLPTPEQAALLVRPPQPAEQNVAQSLLNLGPNTVLAVSRQNEIPSSPLAFEESAHTVSLRDHEQAIAEHKATIARQEKLIADLKEQVRKLEETAAKELCDKVVMDKKDYTNLQEMVQIITTAGIDLAKRSKFFVANKTTSYKIGDTHYDFNEREAAVLLDTMKDRGALGIKIKLVAEKIGLDLAHSSLTGKGNNLQAMDKDKVEALCNFVAPFAGEKDLQKVRGKLGAIAEQLRAKEKDKPL